MSIVSLGKSLPSFVQLKDNGCSPAAVQCNMMSSPSSTRTGLSVSDRMRGRSESKRKKVRETGRDQRLRERENSWWAINCSALWKKMSLLSLINSQNEFVLCCEIRVKGTPILNLSNIPRLSVASCLRSPSTVKPEMESSDETPEALFNSHSSSSLRLFKQPKWSKPCAFH